MPLKGLSFFFAFVSTFLCRAGELPQFELPISQEGELSEVYLLAVEPIDKTWLDEKAYEKCSQGLRLIYLVVAKDSESTDFAISPKPWVKVNGTDYLGISNHLLKIKTTPDILAAEVEPDYTDYAEGIELDGKKTMILEISFPGVELPRIKGLEAGVFTGWFRKGESFEFNLEVAP